MYGGPQGWNPHLFRTKYYLEKALKAFEARRLVQATEARVERAVGRIVSFTFNPSTLIHLRASDSDPVEDVDGTAVRSTTVAHFHT